jgi:low affinity Fe/Cu permease
MWSRLNEAFFRFADWSQRVIASPLHLLLFLVAIGIWAAWSGTRGFDPFSQLVMQSPVAIATYVFGLLTLAAAYAASRKGDAILEELRQRQEQIVREEEEELAKEREILAAIERVEDRLLLRLAELLLELAEGVDVKEER